MHNSTFVLMANLTLSLFYLCVANSACFALMPDGQLESKQDEQEQKAPITFTKPAASFLKPYMESRPGQYLVIGVKVAPNCMGMEYEMHAGAALPKKDYNIIESDGINVAITKKYAQFLRGVEVDYGQLNGSGPTGFMFNHPNSDLLLIPEYQRMKKKRVAEWEANKKRAKDIDRGEAVNRLLTSDRQEAYERLVLYHKYLGPNRDTEPEINLATIWMGFSSSKVSHVVKCPQADESFIVAVFTGYQKGRPTGGLTLYDQKGDEIPVFQNSNYLDEENDLFEDINGDDIIEMTQNFSCSMYDESDPDSSAGSYKEFFVAAIKQECTPLLTIWYDGRSSHGESEWKCLAEKAGTAGTAYDIVLKAPDGRGLKEVARYKWSETDKKFIGPNSGNGFVAFFGSPPDARKAKSYFPNLKHSK